VWAAQTFFVLLAVWVLLNGREGWVTGLVAATLGSAVAGWLAQHPPNRWRPLRLVLFAGSFLAESMRAGLDVAVRTLHPWMPVGPDFFRYPITLPPGPPRTLLVSIITLLPGTLSAELSPSGESLVVHELSAGGRDSVERLERRIAWLFGLELDDPP
jgi:multicomponent Na+:H+ antiporter subunit E